MCAHEAEYNVYNFFFSHFYSTKTWLGVTTLNLNDTMALEMETSFNLSIYVQEYVLNMDEMK
jgi:hypothetical protein